jgi:manganese efflux pump family protein
MIEVLIFGLLAGLDNLQVCSSLGMLPLQRRRLHFLAAAFCASEIGGAVLGLMLGRGLLTLLGPVAESLAPIVMLGCGAAVLYLALRRDDPDLAALANHRALLVGVPISLSFDNVIAGAAISFSSHSIVQAALVIGIISAAMSCIGLYLGHWLRRILPDRIELAVGAYLCFLAVRTLGSGLR